MENFYNLTEEQLGLQEMTRDFALKSLAPVVAECDVKGEYPMEVYKQAWEMGLTTMFIPEEYGGMGLDTKTCCLIREELGRVDVGFTIGVGSNGLAYTPVALAGTDEQKRLAASFIVDGGLALTALLSRMAAPMPVIPVLLPRRWATSGLSTAVNVLSPTDLWPISMLSSQLPMPPKALRA